MKRRIRNQSPRSIAKASVARPQSPPWTRPAEAPQARRGRGDLGGCSGRRLRFALPLQTRRAKPSRDSARRGSALVLVLVLVFITGAGAGLAWRMVQQQFSVQQYAARDAKAHHLAEAGVATAIAALRADPAYRGEADTPLGEGVFTVEVAPGAPGAYRVRAEARLADGPIVRAHTTLVADLRLDAAGRVLALRWRGPEE